MPHTLFLYTIQLKCYIHTYCVLQVGMYGMCVSIQINTGTCRQTHARTRNIYIYIYRYGYIHLYIYIYIRIYICVYTY